MEDFVTFNLSKKLKEKGFKEECLCHYIGDDLIYNIQSPIANYQLWFSHNKFDNIWHRDNYDAPTITQVLKWLREEKELHVEFISNASGYCYIISRTPQRGGSDLYSCFDSGTNDAGEWDDYEEAAMSAIEYILDNNLI